MPKEKAPCKCLSIIMIDSVIKASKKYYPQTFLEECKYMQEKIKIENYINEDLAFNFFASRLLINRKQILYTLFLIRLIAIFLSLLHFWVML